MVILPVRSAGCLSPSRIPGGGLFGSRPFAYPLRGENRSPSTALQFEGAPGAVIQAPFDMLSQGSGRGGIDPRGATRFPDVTSRVVVLGPLVSSRVERHP